MFYGGGASNNINAQIEADRLAAEARGDEPDAADERAESMTNAARAVVASIVIVAIVVGTAWVLFSTTAALIVAGAAGLAAIAVLVRRRSKRPEAGE